MIKKEDLVLNGHFIYQDTEDYRFTSDAVRLANFVKANAKDEVIDLGTGCGIIALLIAMKTKAKHIVGIDINDNNLQLARRSVFENGLADRVEMLKLNIKDALNAFPQGSFSVAVCNPPYYPLSIGETREAPSIRSARNEVEITLAEILSMAARLLKFGGKFYMVHKASRLGEIITLASGNKLVTKKIIFINPVENKNADTALFQFTLGGKEGVSVCTMKDYGGSLNG